jgi:hypothetical protein
MVKALEAMTIVIGFTNVADSMTTVIDVTVAPCR